MFCNTIIEQARALYQVGTAQRRDWPANAELGRLLPPEEPGR